MPPSFPRAWRRLSGRYFPLACAAGRIPWACNGAPTRRSLLRCGLRRPVRSEAPESIPVRPGVGIPPFPDSLLPGDARYYSRSSPLVSYSVSINATCEHPWLSISRLRAFPSFRRTKSVIPAKAGIHPTPYPKATLPRSTYTAGPRPSRLSINVTSVTRNLVDGVVGRISHVKTPPAPTTDTTKREMRLKPARLHTQANMPHGAGHTLMQLAKRDNIALKTGPDHLRAAPPPPFPKSPQPANAQFERSIMPTTAFSSALVRGAALLSSSCPRNASVMCMASGVTHRTSSLVSRFLSRLTSAPSSARMLFGGTTAMNARNDGGAGTSDVTSESPRFAPKSPPHCAAKRDPFRPRSTRPHPDNGSRAPVASEGSRSRITRVRCRWS